MNIHTIALDMNSHGVAFDSRHLGFCQKKTTTKTEPKIQC
jgi:hypothetical protein